MEDKNIKCYIINGDVAIFEYELLDGVRTFQVEIKGYSKKNYVVGNFKSMKDAKEYCKHLNLSMENDMK